MQDELPRFVSDAHPLLWHLALDSRLSDRARAIFEEMDRGEAALFIPAVVLAEMAMVVEKKRVPVTTANLSKVIQQWIDADNVFMTDLTSGLVRQAMLLTTIPDIFDRLIVAEAQALHLPVITIDRAITQSQLVEVIW